jgi:uncharacterized membrane protein YfhO
MKKKFYILSFIIPFLSLFMLFLAKGFIFGDYSILQSDMYHQYYQLLTRLKEILNGSGSLFYTFKIGFGQSFISTFAYYLASPINLIILFLNVKSAITLIILFKISLCGLFMFIYLKKSFKNENSILLIFSTSYALSLQIICNYFNIMWLDAYFLCPLIFLGIDKIINENKSLLYYITLSLAIYCNYYMGYMVCLFSVIYFIYKLVLKYSIKDKLEILAKIKKFIIVSILAGMSTMILNLPNLLSLASIDRSTITYPDIIGTFNTYVSLNLSKLFIFSQDFDKFYNSQYVYYYCGIMITILLPLYFVNKDISKKERIASFVLLLLLALSIFITPLNNVWHVFDTPLGFNYRYYYLFLVVILSLCLKSLLNSKKYNKYHFTVITLIYTFIGLFCYICGDIKYISLIMSIIIMIIYSLLIYYYNNGFDKIKNMSKLFLIIFSILELYLNIYNLFDTKYFFIDNYIGYKNNNKTSILNVIRNQDSDKFYRVEFYNTLYNDSLMYNYNSLSAWYSTINGVLVNKLGDLGYYNSLNQYKYNKLIMLDSIFGLKYYISDTAIDEYNYITNIPLKLYDSTSNQDLIYNNYIYENPYALSLGFMVSDDALNELKCDDAFICQNEFVSNLSMVDTKYYEKANIKQIDDYVYEFEIENNNDFMLVIKSLDEDFNYDIYLNDSLIKTSTSNYEIVEFNNNANIGTKFKIYLKNITGNFNLESINVYYKALDSFKEAYNVLSLNQLDIEVMSDTYIKGNINVTDNNILFTSIPYDKGFSIYVDGKKYDTIAISDTFLGCVLPIGDHEIEIVYKTKGLNLGILISLVSICLYGMCYYFEKKKNKTVI